MNYVAHLHIAQATESSLIGAFLGDFVKGDAYKAWPQETQDGIILHRKVDTFTDKHPSVVGLRAMFPKSLRRMAGVVIDIYFDHLLTAKLTRDGEKGLAFLDDFYHDLHITSLPQHGHFVRLQSSLMKDKWLSDYQHQQTCFLAFRAIEKRLKNKIEFAELAQVFIEGHHKYFRLAFEHFYPELLEFSHDAYQEIIDIR